MANGLCRLRMFLRRSLRGGSSQANRREDSVVRLPSRVAGPDGSVNAASLPSEPFFGHPLPHWVNDSRGHRRLR